MDVTVTVSTMDGGNKRFRAQEGVNMLDALRREGVPIPAACGGRGSCGKCQIVVDKPSAYPPNEAEKRLLSPEQLATGLRLACTRVLTQDIACRLPVAMQDAAITTDSAAASGETDPIFRRVALTIPAAGLDSQRSDEERLLEAAGLSSVSLTALRALPEAVRGQEGAVTALCREGLAVDICPGEGSGAPLGVAVDIGTTTLAAYLMDLESGTELAVASRLNPQKAYGDDVISRTDYTLKQSGGLETLRRLIVDAVSGLTQELCAQAGATLSRVVHMTIAGNPIMLHLFAGVPPACIVEAPFIPAFSGRQDFRAEQLGLVLHPEAMVTTLPCVSGYVGADTVAVALAVGLLNEERPCLMLDIGTNGEIMLGDRDGILACSAAAGPAFEGAHIRYGMGGVAGAISRVEMDDALGVRTIADAPAAGICGSAIVDVTAGLLAHGALDETGRLQPAGPGWLRERFVREEQGWALRLASPGEGAQRDILFCQRDVREVQLAKGAVAAGIETLLRERGIGEDEVRAVFLAGG
ncbi:MAG: DUF4445 domain-containing protein, partial [Clostridiales bacterium]|nr:DUF4445 domain-containing protein [Clostridiales bacterium]